MKVPERFSNLPDYAFPRLRTLLDSHAPGGPPIHMSIGEPKHPFPSWVQGIIDDHVGEFAKYPPNDGSPELLAAIAGWLERRYGAEVDAATQIMALNGTREGLFNAVLALCPETARHGQTPVVVMPNPFYQVYAVAALAAGAQPVYVPATRGTGFLPDYASLPGPLLDRVEIAFLCSPANPQGVIASLGYWDDLLDLAERHDFRIFADECYSELYRDAPPPGVLEAADARGTDPERVFAFHSLSKRSNLPGLRSGFVTGGPDGMAEIKRLRSYAGAPLPLPLQRVAEAAWADEVHVEENRALYVRKYDIADEIFDGVPGYRSPEAGFFLWLPVNDGEEAALRLWTETGVRVLPGAYLSRDTDQGNPGSGYVRVAMVAPEDEMRRGLTKIRACLYG